MKTPELAELDLPEPGEVAGIDAAGELVAVP